MAKKRYKEIPSIVHSECFLWFVAYFLYIFKKNQGYGRWLKEYQQMDAKDWFTPKKLKELYIPILEGTSRLSYIYWDAVNSICTQALDRATAFMTIQHYEIRTITGVIAIDDNDFELTGLTLNYAIKTCKAMNEEAEEELFKVYNSKTKRPINKIYYQYPTF